MRVLLDANVLYGQFPRYLLLSLATRGVLEPYWSDEILREMADALIRHGLSSVRVAEQAAKLRQDWPEALASPAAMTLPLGFTLPDANDTHVVRAALAARASVILTFNLDDFPVTSLAPLGIRAQAPGMWCRERWEHACATGTTADFLDALRGHRATLKKPTPWTSEQYHAALERCGFPELASALSPSQL